MEFDKEIELIENGHIKEIVRLTLEKAPDYFWTQPSSSTGKYHPIDELGEGGILIHVRKAVKIGIDLCRMYNVSGLSRDYIVAALLVHDICKEGYPESSGHMVMGHGYLVAQVMRDAGILNSDAPDGDVATILELASTHMGRWDIPFYPPSNNSLSLVVHLADYIASRRYITIDTEESS